MKNLKSKKLLSAIAVVAVSATAVCAALPLSACGNNDSATVVEDGVSTKVIATALGEQVTRESGTVYYVAPGAPTTGSGESWDDPANIATLLGKDEYTTTLKPGDTIYVKPGKYELFNTIPLHASGSYSKYINIINAAYDENSGYELGENEAPEAVLDFSGQAFASTARGVQIYGNYIYWYGIDICGAGDNGMYIGGSYNTIEFSEFYNNRDTGLQLGRSYSDTTDSKYNYIDNWPSYNLIKNCTSHNNYDNETYGENADGFAAKLTVGYANVFDGCIAYRNSDDGWDLYAKTESGNIGTVIMYNCVAYENGYLEYTQRECNKLFPTWSGSFSEDKSGTAEAKYGLESYKTRDGDGNGFKLGGSVMDGDVLMYNCLSFNNRMHGVTDNSNPGFLDVRNTTSYDNSAAIDNNPDSKTFGQIISAVNDDEHGNINMARQTYSYNSLRGVLSVKSSIPQSLEADEYRGSVTDSVLLGVGAANKISGSMTASTRSDEDKKAYTTEAAALVAGDVFKTLPIVKGNDGYTHNLTGLKDLYKDTVGGALNPERAHLAFRNADGSINMGDVLAKKDGVDDTLLIKNQKIGSELNYESWEAYTHFYENDLVDGSKESEPEAIVARVIEALTLSVDNQAVYQNFDVPSRLLECDVEWTSGDTDYVEVGDVKDVSVSLAEYYTIKVTRPEDADKTVTLTVKVSITENGEELAADTRTFTLTIKAGDPEIGEISVVSDNPEIAANEKEVFNNGRFIIDRYTVFSEPEVKVVNGLYWDGERYLEEDDYTVETTYRYRPNLNASAVVVKGFSSSNAGVFEITHKITLKNYPSKTATMSYEIYVAGTTSSVDFATTKVDNQDVKATITVNRDGFTIGGTPTSATGYLYVVVSPTELTGSNAVTAANIKSNSNVQTYSFKDTSILAQFENANKAEYYIYYAMGNVSGSITSQVYTQKIGVCPITSPAEFNSMAMGSKIGDEDTATTIYMLTKDLDFTGVTYSMGTNSFKGLFNGAGHTISNITLTTGSKGAENCGVFYKVSNGTIENVKFNNIIIGNNKTSLTKIGLVSECSGGYFYNIAMTNVSVGTTNQRAGALIGYVPVGSPVYIDQVSLINDADHKIEAAQRAGGLVGFSQASSADAIEIYMSNCYVDSTIIAGFEVGGIFGTYDCGNNPNCYYNLEITSCVFAGTVIITDSSKTYGSGILGYQKGSEARMRIESCIFMGEIYATGGEVKLTSGLKNASGILGSFGSVFSEGITSVVKNCLSLIEEYNTDYDVTAMATLKYEFTFSARLDVSSWNFIYDETDKTHMSLKAPFVELMFLAY